MSGTFCLSQVGSWRRGLLLASRAERPGLDLHIQWVPQAKMSIGWRNPGLEWCESINLLQQLPGCYKISFLHLFFFLSFSSFPAFLSSFPFSPSSSFIFFFIFTDSAGVCNLKWDCSDFTKVKKDVMDPCYFCPGISWNLCMIHSAPITGTWVLNTSITTIITLDPFLPPFLPQEAFYTCNLTLSISYSFKKKNFNDLPRGSSEALLAYETLHNLSLPYHPPCYQFHLVPLLLSSLQPHWILLLSSMLCSGLSHRLFPLSGMLIPLLHYLTPTYSLNPNSIIVSQGKLPWLPD